MQLRQYQDKVRIKMLSLQMFSKKKMVVDENLVSDEIYKFEIFKKLAISENKYSRNTIVLSRENK